jgi:MFS family permease
MQTSTRLLLLRHRSFGLLWTAGLISMTGDWLLMVALPIYVYQLTGSPSATAGAVAARVVITLVVSPLAGVYVDRWDRKRVMVFANVLQAATLLPLLAFDSANRLWLAYLVIAAQALLTAFAIPAEHSLLPRLVPPEDLQAANGLSALNNNVARLIGPAAGGLVAATLGMAGAVWLDSASFLLAAVLSGLIAGTHRAAAEGARRHLLRELWQGIEVIWGSTMVRALMAIIVVIGIGEGIMGSLVAVFVADALHGGVRELGWLMSAQAVGGIAGGLATGMFARRFAATRLLSVGLLLFGTLDLALFNYPRWTSAFAPAVVLLVLVGIPGAVMTAAWFTLMQLGVADELRARAISVVLVLESGAMLIGAALAGTLTGKFGVINVLTGQGLGYVLAAGVFVLLIRGRTTMDTTSRPPVIGVTAGDLAGVDPGRGDELGEPVTGEVDFPAAVM